MKTCIQCKLEPVKYRGHDPRRRFCSQLCFQVWQHEEGERARANFACASPGCAGTDKGQGRFCVSCDYRRGEQSRRRYALTCRGCGIQFEARRPGKKFHSYECFLTVHRLPEQPCERCGVLFSPDVRTRRFCSVTCKARHFAPLLRKNGRNQFQSI